MDLDKAEIKLLRCLVALVEEASVTKAAARMGLSQPRMSNALNRLRALCADPLLVPAGRQLVATQRALEISRHVESALREVGSAFSATDGFDPAKSEKSFILMMSDYTAGILLSDVFQRIENVAPHVKISLLHMSHEYMHRALEDGDCDLAFGYFRNLHPNMRVTKCFEDRPICIASASLACEKSISLDFFVAARHLTMGQASGSVSTIDVVCDRELLALGKRRSIAGVVESPLALARIISKTHMLGLLPWRVANEYAKQLPLQFLDIPIPLQSFDVSMLWHERSHKDGAHTWLRRQFQHVAASLS